MHLVYLFLKSADGMRDPSDEKIKLSPHASLTNVQAICLRNMIVPLLSSHEAIA